MEIVGGQEGSTHARLILPDSCTGVTLMLTHADLSAATSPIEVEVGAYTSDVTDLFDRVETAGWGTSTSGRLWSQGPPPAGPVDGSVDGQAGLFMIRPALTTAQIGPLGSGVRELLGVGRFTDCQTGLSAVVVSTGTPVFVTTAGLVFGGTATVQLDANFDPCQPWYMRAETTDGTLQVKVWQAISPEPVDWLLTTPNTGTDQDHLVVRGFGVSGILPTEAFKLEIIDVDLQPTG